MELLAIVCASPGISKSDLLRQAGIGWGTVSHHLRVLCKQGRIRIEPLASRTVVLPAGHPLDGFTAGLLRAAETAAILAYVKAHPGVGIQEICGALRLSRKVVMARLSGARQVGLVTRSDAFRGAYHMAPSALQERQLAVTASSMSAARGPFVA